MILLVSPPPLPVPMSLLVRVFFFAAATSVVVMETSPLRAWRRRGDIVSTRNNINNTRETRAAPAVHSVIWTITVFFLSPSPTLMFRFWPSQPSC